MNGNRKRGWIRPVFEAALGVALVCGTPRLGQAQQNLPPFVEDTSGLMWSQPLRLEDGSVYAFYTWYEAVQLARNCELEGYGDWRLPTVDEFFAAFDDGTLVPWLTDCGYVWWGWGSISYSFWSSENWPVGRHKNDYASTVRIAYDSCARTVAPKTDGRLVIFVRGGAKPKKK